ncbi:hypothetical protein V1512DRAFT_262308 [Lipomyces arxii]|uniref:uncharacterized protein n=1 Tax=Lipomyces arxii TaxID=56418 RepID=UPI0034CDB26F
MSSTNIEQGGAEELQSSLESNNKNKKEPSSTGADHLARVRENQRRSRARKREYVSDLETKIRSCHEEGLQLNVQIQRTARRVVEENKRLRELLARVGVDERAVEDWLRNEAPSEYDSPSSITRQEEEELLKAKHPCATCGSAPAKIDRNSASPVGATSVPVAAAAVTSMAPVQQISQLSIQPVVPIQPMDLAQTPIVSQPVAFPDPYAYAASQSVVNGLSNDIINPAMTMKSPFQDASHNFVPVDFTAYFQSVDIDNIPLTPQQYYV